MRKVMMRGVLVVAAVVAACEAGAVAAPGESTVSAAYVSPESAGHDQRLDIARSEIVGAIVLVDVSQNPSAKDPDRPFGGHDEKAIRALEKALEEIDAAIAYAEQSN